MKTTVKYILAAVLAAAAMLPVSAQDMPGQTMMPDSADVYTIEQCYDLVRQNYPLVKRYELLDLTHPEECLHELFPPDIPPGLSLVADRCAGVPL